MKTATPAINRNDGSWQAGVTAFRRREESIQSAIVRDARIPVVRTSGLSLTLEGFLPFEFPVGENGNPAYGVENDHGALPRRQRSIDTKLRTRLHAQGGVKALAEILYAYGRGWYGPDDRLRNNGYCGKAVCGGGSTG